MQFIILNIFYVYFTYNNAGIYIIMIKSEEHYFKLYMFWK